MAFRDSAIILFLTLPVLAASGNMVSLHSGRFSIVDTEEFEDLTREATLITSVEASAGAFQPAMHAFVLWQASQLFSAKKLQSNADEALHQAFAATLSNEVRQIQKEFLQTQILQQIARANLKDTLELLPAAEPQAQRNITDFLIQRNIATADYEGAEKTIIACANRAGFPFAATEKLMRSLPQTESIRRRALFARALSAFVREQPSATDSANDFAALVTRHWRSLPPELVLESVDALLKNARQQDDSDGVVRVASEDKTITFRSLFEYRVFQVLPILEQLSPQRAADLARNNTANNGLQGEHSTDSPGMQNSGTAQRQTTVSKGTQAGVDELAAQVANLKAKVMAQAKTDPKGALAQASTLPASQPDFPDSSPRMDALTAIAFQTAERDPAISKAALKEARGLSESLPPWAYLHQVRRIADTYLRIGEPEEASRTLRDALSGVKKLYSADTDRDNPNLALKAHWPSTFIYMELAVSANKISPALADEIVLSISDEEIKAVVSLRTIADRENIPLTGYALETLREK